MFIIDSDGDDERDAGYEGRKGDIVASPLLDIRGEAEDEDEHEGHHIYGDSHVPIQVESTSEANWF